LSVSEGDSDALFVLFDTDVHYLVGKSCAKLVSQSKVSLFRRGLCLMDEDFNFFLMFLSYFVRRLLFLFFDLSMILQSMIQILLMVIVFA